MGLVSPLLVLGQPAVLCTIKMASLLVELIPGAREAQAQTLPSEELGLVGVRVLLVESDVLRVGHRFLPCCPGASLCPRDTQPAFQSRA